MPAACFGPTKPVERKWSESTTNINNISLPAYVYACIHLPSSTNSYNKKNNIWISTNIFVYIYQSYRLSINIHDFPMRWASTINKQQPSTNKKITSSFQVWFSNRTFISMDPWWSLWFLVDGTHSRWTSMGPGSKSPKSYQIYGRICSAPHGLPLLVEAYGRPRQELAQRHW